ncbi:MULTISPECIES: MoxR family ATPase [Haloferax]|uniref:AAA domain-containing protein n=2 Tax=Haloferax TaxID=2251 RepID=A0A6G1Z0T5_9EURY|nr:MULTISPECIES: MoxR family ATPase [Haloferax]KAB1187544.1 MoxR family ATPase [Haloferax sp. CBA1149]MRW80199.1 AAA domain-containing protein [Haloferax marinisediminis]
MHSPEEIYSAILDETSQLLVGNEDAIEGLTIALLTNGHVLLEGVPGVAKTTIANLFSHAADLDFQRIQMTPDVLPADITGTHIYRENLGEFDLQRGPVFSNVVLADEINRATPKTQSALLEAMEEGQVTIEGETLQLPHPFMVIATQNPIEYEGTFNLPEAQRDRFQFKIIIDLPERKDEREVLERFHRSPSLKPADITNVITDADIGTARNEVNDVHVDDKVFDYILDLVEATRTHPEVEYGASPRASLAFLRSSKAAAAIHGRGYVIPDDVKRLAPLILSHRLVLGTEADISGRTPREIVREVVDSVPTPDVEPAESQKPPVAGDD